MPTVTTANVALAVTIQGVPQVFVERPVAVALFQDDTSADRAQQVCLAAGGGGVTLGRRTLDLAARAETGAEIGLTLTDRGATAAADGFGLALADLFAVRSQADTHLTAAIAEATAMTGAGTITLADSTAGAMGSHATRTCYIGGEAFIYTGTTSTTLTGVTRAAHGTRAQQHHDGTGMAAIDGSGVWFDALPSYRGREVTVYAVDMDAATKEAIAIGTLGGPPQLQDATAARWTLAASSLADMYRERLIGVGLRETAPNLGEEIWQADDGTAAQFQVPDIDWPLFETSSNTATILLAELDGGSLIMRWNEGTTSPDLVDTGATGTPPYIQPLLTAEQQANVAAQLRYRSLRHIAVVDSTAPVVALMTLLSDLGDLDSAHSTTYDRLPGHRSTGESDPEWRMGAGLLATQVDAAAFLAVGFDGPRMQNVIGLDGPTTVGEFLADWCAMTGTYWYVNSSGQITVSRLRSRTPPSESTVAVAVTDATLAVTSPEQLAVDESSIAATHTLHADYDPLAGAHMVTVNVTDHEITRRYPEDSGHAVTSTKLGSISVGSLRPPSTDQHWVRAAGEHPDSVRSRLRRAQAAGARPAAEWHGVTTSWAARTVAPGDIIQVTNERLPDLTGGVHSSAAPWLVLGVQVNPDTLTVTLDLRSLAIGYLIAPTFTVSSGSNPYTYTNTPGSAAERHSGATPGNHFAVLWDVWCMDDTGANFPELKRVTALTGTTLTLNSAPSFTPTHIIPAAVQRLSGAATGTEANAAGYDRGDYLIQCDDDGTYTISATAYPGTKWS